MTDPRRRRPAPALCGIVLVAGWAALPGSAQALEPWVLPETARPCPHLGPGFFAAPGSRTCVRIGGRVTADFDAAARPVAGGAETRPRNGFNPHVQVRVEARTETELGDLTLIYQTDDPRRRRPAR